MSEVNSTSDSGAADAAAQAGGNTNSGLESVTQDAPQGGETAEATPAEIKKYNLGKIKFRGQEIEVNDITEDEMRRHVQRSKGSSQAYEEAKKYRGEAEKQYREVEQWRKDQAEQSKRIQQDPIRFAIEQGADPLLIQKLTEDHVMDQINREQMSPEARRILELEKQMQDQTKTAESAEQERQSAALMQAAEQQRQKIVPEILKAADAVGLGKTAGNIKRVAQLLHTSTKAGHPLNVAHAVQIAHEENSTLVKSTMGSQATQINDAFKAKDIQSVLRVGKEIESYLGSDILFALQRYGIIKHQHGAPKMPSNTVDTAKSVQPIAEYNTISSDEAEELRKQRVAKLQQNWESSRNSAVRTP